VCPSVAFFAFFELKRPMGLICGKSSTETTRSRREYGHRIIRSLAAHGKKSKKILCEMERSMAKATMKENCEVVIRLDGAPVVTLGGGKNRDVIEYEFLKKYKFMRLLGSGAYSMVFLADTKSESEDHDPELPPSLNIHNSINKSSATSHHHLSSMDHVAVKVVPRVIASEAYENAIRREALILKKVGSHPHIIRLHDFVISDRNFFLCMECAPSTCVDTGTFSFSLYLSILFFSLILPRQTNTPTLIQSHDCILTRTPNFNSLRILFHHYLRNFSKRWLIFIAYKLHILI